MITLSKKIETNLINGLPLCKSNIDDETVIAIVEYVKKNPDQIKQPPSNFAQNQISDRGARALRAFDVTVLDLSRNKIQRLTRLNPIVTTLTLSCNPLQIHPNLFQSSFSLTSLDLSENELTDQSLNVLSKAPHLYTLILNRCKITDNKLLTIMRSESISSLALQCNSFTEASIRSLAKNSRLTALDLSSNSLRNDAVSILKSTTSLTSLRLNDNQITSDGMLAFNQHPSIRYLSIANNNLERIPPPFAQRATFLFLDISKSSLPLGSTPFKAFEHNPHMIKLLADEEYLKTNPKVVRRLARNEWRLEDWKRIVILIAFIRANYGHPFVDSILGIIKNQIGPLLGKALLEGSNDSV